MGTRGAMGIRIGGQDKIAYCHFDAYPDGLGAGVVADVRALGVERLMELGGALKKTPDRPPSDAEWDSLARFCDAGVGERGERDWYKLLRRTQGNLAAMLEAGVYEDSADFMRDSLFCEWAYVVNLDECTLEVYRGHQKEEHASGRYAGLGQESGYWPVALLATYKLDDIPEDWTRSVETMAYGGDDS